MGRRGCDHAVHVKMHERHFIVEFNEVDEVLRIKERKRKEHPQVGVYDVSWWVAACHPWGSGNTMPKRIAAAAKAKWDVENRAFDATP